MPAATDEQESEPKTAEPIDEWARLEYEEANRYGRTVYETIFRLAQMTFVINPALGAGFYYVFFEKKDKLFSEIGIVGVAVAVLGIVYNLGAYGVYVQSHAFLEALLIRIREIDKITNCKMHLTFEATAPYSYRRFWGDRAINKVDSADVLTRVFLRVLFISWATVFGYAVYELVLPHNKFYLFGIEAAVIAGCVAILILFAKMKKSQTAAN